jgi:hypothetical protein
LPLEPGLWISWDRGSELSPLFQYLDHPNSIPHRTAPDRFQAGAGSGQRLDPLRVRTALDRCEAGTSRTDRVRVGGIARSKLSLQLTLKIVRRDYLFECFVVQEFVGWRGQLLLVDILAKFHTKKKKKAGNCFSERL